MGWHKPLFVLVDEPYGHYEEAHLNPDESCSSLDEARAERAADYQPARRSPTPASSAAQESDSMRRPSRDAARVDPSDARRDRDKAA